MSGHSKWATTHRQKSAADAKKGAAFTKLANLITVAARQGGGDIDNNFQLRLAVDKAREANMPKDNIDRAIKRGLGVSDGSVALEEVVYEAFGPAGSAFMIEAITDNRNRTISEIKAALNKNGGQIAGPNSVAWMFERKGYIFVKNASNTNIDELELAAIDGGADEIEKNDERIEVFSSANDLQQVINKIKPLAEIEESGLTFKAKEEIQVSQEEDQQKIEKLYSALDDLDDVNNVYTNASW